jgi:hypothetical protein
MPMKWLVAGCSLLIASLGFAQKPVRDKAISGPVPTVKLTFVKESDAPKVAASLVLYGPMGCTQDGNFFIETASPADLRKSALSSIAIDGDSYSATSFSLDTLSDLHDAQLKAYFATESEVVALLNATRNDALSTSKHTLVVPKTGESFERETRSGTRHDYLATFDRQGNYKGSVELDVPFTVRKIAVFGSGLLLVIGFDTDNQTKFAFVNADGSLQRFLDTDKSLAGSEKMMEALDLLKTQPDAFRANPHPSLGLAQIVSFRDKLLFVLTGMTWIVEITPGGVLRRIAIDVPQGFVIDRFIPSQKTWYAALRRYGSDSSPDQENVFYEFSPDNGVAVRRFDTTPQYTSEIACEHDGEFEGLAYDVKGLIVFTAKP